MNYRQQIKREEAEKRNEEWRKLTPEQQIKILKTRPGKSIKQIAKIRKTK